MVARELVELGRQRGVDAGRNDHRGPAFDAPGKVERRSHILMRQCDDGQIGPGLRQIGEGAFGLDVEKDEVSAEPLSPQEREQGLRLGCLGGGVVPLAGKDGDGVG